MFKTDWFYELLNLSNESIEWTEFRAELAEYGNVNFSCLSGVYVFIAKSGFSPLLHFSTSPLLHFSTSPLRA